MSTTTSTSTATDTATGSVFDIVIGIEVHVELATRTKMFCRCRNGPFELAPNAAVCPTCLGLPGALPVINREAVRLGLRAALALGCEVAEICQFERKLYPYPDLVKGYQISQYELPLGRGGGVEIFGEAGEAKTIPIHRIHLEEDTAKLVHRRASDGQEISEMNCSRSGVPLLEIVTEPEIHSAEDAEGYLRQLRNLLIHNGVSHCRMERGEMRLEANISLKPRGSEVLGNRVEVKNQSSFRFVRDAIAYEVERQSRRLGRGEEIVQETRGWDPERRRTFPQRAKEDAHDYRYFPDPDLPPVQIDPAWIAAERRAMPESLDHFRTALVEAGVPSEDVQAMMDNETIAFLNEAHRLHPDGVVLAAKWLVREVFALLNEAKIPIEESRLAAAEFVAALRLVEAGKLNAQGMQTVIQELFKDGGEASEIIARRGLTQVNDKDALGRAVDEVLTEQDAMVAQYRAGKTKVRQALFGKVMQKTKGRADPKAVGELLDERLKGSS